MPRTELTPKSGSDIDHRKAILSLRWLLVILASYLTLFSYVGTELFPFVFGFALAFSASNFALMLIPRTQFLTRRARALISVLDFFFVSATLYLLRVPEDYLYVTFAAIFILALIWRDLRLVLFSLFVVSLLFGVFSYFRLFGFQFDTDIERFLTLALFFVVAIFYVFLSERLTEDATISRTMTEENRIAEVMVEMTRALSSSLNTDDVLYSIVSRLHQVLEAEECSIVRVDSKTGSAKVVVKLPNLEQGDVALDLDLYPELNQAYISRQFVFLPDAKPTAVMVVPMIVAESVLGLIYVRSPKLGPILPHANIRFFEVMASTAANALRNARTPCPYGLSDRIAESPFLSDNINDGVGSRRTASSSALAAHDRSRFLKTSERPVWSSERRPGDSHPGRNHSNQLPRNRFRSSIRRRGVHGHSS